MTAHPTPHPDPGKKKKKEDLTPQEKTMECVKNAHRWAIIFERAKPKEEKKKSTMPVLFPLNIYTLDSKPCSHKVENGYNKTWLEK